MCGLNELIRQWQVRFLEEDEENHSKKVAELEFLLKNCQFELQDEKENRGSESAAWCQSVSDKSRLCEDLQTQVRELQNELASVRRKHAVNMKVETLRTFTTDFDEMSPTISIDVDRN